MSVGGEFARREVDEGLYRSRWERAILAEQKLLRVMGERGGDAPVAIADLAKAMGKRRVSDLSVARNEVIKKGLLYAPERGWLAFAVPGVHAFHRPTGLTPDSLRRASEGRYVVPAQLRCGRLADVLVGRRTRHKHLGRSITALTRMRAGDGSEPGAIPASSVYHDVTRAELLRHLCWRTAPGSPGAALRPLTFLTSWHLTDNLTRRR